MSYHWDYLNPKAYNNRVGFYNFKKVFQFLLTHSEGIHSKILDIAGGSGRFALPLSAYSNDVTVIDINLEAIKLLQSRNQSIKSICGDFIEEELEGNYSLATCMEAMGYFSDLQTFFTKIHALLAKDGMLIFNYTNPDSWRFTLRKLRHWRTGPTPYNDIALSDLKLLLKACQFEIVCMEGMYWLPLPLSSNSILVDFFAWIEQKFTLYKWHSQSPWLIIAIRKISK